MDLRFPIQFSSLHHSASTLVFSADLEPNLTTLLFIFKKAIEDCVIGKCMFNEWERKGFRSAEK
jgi:hypothetical protein